MGKVYRSLLLVALMVTSGIASAPIVHAEDGECQHVWENDGSGWNYQEISDTQHSYSQDMVCSKCGDYKTVTVKENHTFEKAYEHDYKKISNTQHSFTQEWRCSECYKYKETTEKEKHTFDKYHTCKQCYESVAKNITLAPNKTAYVNEKSWIKINIKQKGYIQVTTTYKYSDGEVYHPSWNLYNSKKAVFVDSKYNDSKECIPVKKGTYYIKVAGDCAIKYTFKKDPSKKNYTLKKAVKLPKNKKVTTVFYSTDKKNTWLRYYKITLTKAQKIRFNVTHLGAGYSYYGFLVDSKGKYVESVNEYDKNGDVKNQISKKKLKKGTYYLVNDYYCDSSLSRHTGEVLSVSWK